MKKKNRTHRFENENVNKEFALYMHHASELTAQAEASTKSESNTSNAEVKK